MENLIQIKNPMLRKFQYCVERYANSLIYYEIIKTGSYKRTWAEKIPLIFAKYTDDGKPPKISIPTAKDDVVIGFLKDGKQKLKEISKEKYFLDLINDEYSQKARLILLDEIEESLAQDKQQTTAYIRDVLRWILYTTETTDFDNNSRFFRNINIRAIIEPTRIDTYKALLSDLLDVDYNKNSELWLVNGIISLCWWFYDIFHTKCEDYGYNTDEIYKSMYIIDSGPQQPNITHENTEKAQSNNIEDNKKNPNTFLPQQLQSQQALEYLEKAIKLGFLDTNYQWICNGHTRYQQAYLANGISEALEISNKWKVFGDLWGYSRLSQSYSNIINNGCLVANKKALDSIWDN